MTSTDIEVHQSYIANLSISPTSYSTLTNKTQVVSVVIQCRKTNKRSLLKKIETSSMLPRH